MNPSQYSCSKTCLVLVSAIGLSLTACGEGLDLPACTATHRFSTAAVPASSIVFVAPIGTMAPVGGSPLPKAHTGFMLNSADVAVTSPGDLIITSIRETTYLVSPSRAGYVDYSFDFAVCDEVSGHFGHLKTLATAIQSQFTSPSCSQYDTVDETVRSCIRHGLSISVSAGAALGTTGTPPHSPALDIGMKDTRITDYVNPSRYPNPEHGTLSPWEWFTGAVQTELYALAGDGSTVITETPRGGTMSIDLAGTAKGRWTLQSAPADGNDAAASDFFVLAPNPYAAQTQAVISTRIAVLDVAALPKFTLQGSGRLNINPANITPDGLIYCYDTNLGTSTYSFLVQMTSASVLRAEKKTHAAGASVCNAAPGTWAFSGAAVDLIR